MHTPSAMAAYLEQLDPQQLRSTVISFLAGRKTPEERIAAIEEILRGPAGPELRRAMGRWVTERMVPVERLVPEKYARWRPVVRDAMLFVMSYLSAARLAPKLLEQIELPLGTRPETRLLRLISKVPGLQKLGQVLAHNRHLTPPLRQALIRLENGIRDVTAREIREMIREQLGPRLRTHQVTIRPGMLSEASVSAVLRFTWKSPASGEQEAGVFKVLKPHIAACFAEDMAMLQALTAYFGKRLGEYGFESDVLSDTFAKVRRLLQHEVDFRGEQATLLRAYELYRPVHGVRVPRLMPELCTTHITAISEEKGIKITDAAARMPRRRRVLVADQLIEALVAVPLLSADKEALFHADPHAGNLLYNDATDELVILDWALCERLTREQRRHLALLLLMLGLRDPQGVTRAVEALQQPGGANKARTIREFVPTYIAELSWKPAAGGVDAMRLVERLTLRGVRFPASLVMLSKVLFTLDGIIADIAGSDVPMTFAVTSHLLQTLLVERKRVALPLKMSDWMALQCSAALYGARLLIRIEEMAAEKVLRATA
ncbi:MAG TPA: AarF/UbiB family protein [Terriglobales bacterium]|nr:AarF/UbiB family protein [Terriglobales bacterium]